MDFRFLDSFSNFLETHRVLEEGVLYDLALLKAVVMYRPQQFAGDGTLQEFDSVATEIGSIIDSFGSERVDQHMISDLKNPLMRLGLLTNKVRNEHYVKSKQPKPSRMDFPRIGTLGFVEHLVEYLKELLKIKANSIGALMFYISRLQQKLHLLSSHLMKIPEPRKEQADLKDLIQGITNLAYEVEYAIDSFLIGDIVIWYGMFWLRDLLKEVKLKKRLVMIESGDKMAIIKSILPKVPVKFNIIPIFSNTEINMKVVGVFNTKQIIVKFSVRTRGLVSCYEERKKEVFHELLVKAEPYSSNVLCNIKQDELNNLVEELQKLLKNKKYFIILQDVSDIDVFYDIRGVLPNGCNGSTILLTTPSPDLVLQCRYGSQKYVHNKVPGDQTSMSHTYRATTDEDVVGFKDEIEVTMEMLYGGPKELRIISIVGMPGQGKTTLAKKLYDHSSKVEYFDVQAWCYVSQVYKKRELLLKLLDQVDSGPTTSHHLNDEELSGLLWKNLKGRRFLIVLDDLWSTEAWNDLRRCFPKEKSGSRIIFTTRQKELATQAQFGSSVQLGPLSETESWTLLLKRLPQPESCPPKLLEVGRQIARNCKGLPFLVIVTAGLLAKVEKNEDKWKQIAETLSSRVLDQEAWAKGVIELSYKHLPDNLKPCFLYFGVFLEGKEVSAKKLIRLWIAEGFIKPIDSKSLEDIANDYLTNLIGRSLVTVAQEKSNGGVKSCHMHDLLRNFCLTKAREENFLQLIRHYDELFPPSKRPITHQLRRLCIYSKVDHLSSLMPGPFVRSLLLFASGDMLSSHSYDISFVSHKFKLLNILDLEDIIIGDSFEAIFRLVHLKYLAIQSNMDLIIPSSVSNMWKLETFLVKAKVVQVPDSIWDMSKLRHVHINEIASFNLEPGRLEKNFVLDNLQTFSTPCLAHGDDVEKMLRRLPGIRKLKCIFLDSWDTATNCSQFPALEVLTQLVSLEVFYDGKKSYPCMFHFPSNLRKLTLSNFRMPWNKISQLATLHNLEVLKLLDNAFEGETWQMQVDEKFQQLKFLKLELLNFETWGTSSDNFPRLKHLVLSKCEQLTEIPLYIGDIDTLEMIKVISCNHGVAISAKRIQEWQVEFGNESLKIHLHPKLQGPELSSSAS